MARSVTRGDGARFAIGDTVERIGDSDGKNGSRGEVLEIDENGRCRVFWHSPARSPRTGHLMFDPKRTWMRPAALRVVTE